ncbi:MAG: hypothetical protein Q8O03_05785 [Nanoarchaeota archaeon]|nr:hypothetical protein [Nanoarchaeota archaeon]
MKIPKTFIPEKELEGKVNSLLEEKSLETKEQFSEKSLQASITRLERRKIPSFYSSNKIYVEVADCLRINFEGGENLYACITFPVIRGVCEKRTTTYKVKEIQEKADSMACKAAKKLKKLEKHVDLVKLTDKINNDSELLEGLCEFFKKYSLEGDYEIEFEHGGSHIVKKHRNNPLVSEEYAALHDLYSKHLTKYVLDGKGKGFLYSLKTGVKNLFKKN